MRLPNADSTPAEPPPAPASSTTSTSAAAGADFVLAHKLKQTHQSTYQVALQGSNRASQTKEPASLHPPRHKGRVPDRTTACKVHASHSCQKPHYKLNTWRREDHQHTLTSTPCLQQHAVPISTHTSATEPSSCGHATNSKEQPPSMSLAGVAMSDSTQQPMVHSVPTYIQQKRFQLVLAPKSSKPAYSSLSSSTQLLSARPAQAVVKNVHQQAPCPKHHVTPHMLHRGSTAGRKQHVAGNLQLITRPAKVGGGWL